MRNHLIVLLALGIFTLLSTTLFGQIVSNETTHGSISETVIDTLALLFLLFGTYFAWDLYSMMKGGELAGSWGWLSGASVIFAIIKIIEVAGRAGYFPVPATVISFGYLSVAFFLFMGFMKQRRTLG